MPVEEKMLKASAFTLMGMMVEPWAGILNASDVEPFAKS